MYFNKINKVTIALLGAALVGLYSCGKISHGHDGHGHGGHDHSHGGGDENATTTKLTEEQVEAIGVEFGSLEYKNLTAGLKVNGVLKVPNNRKGNITSLYGGVVKSLTVQVGDKVAKGQVIATIANPEFVQLQENYLVATSKLKFAKQEVERQQELFDGNAGILKNLQNAKAEYNTLLAQKESLQRQIALVGINPNRVSKSNIKSVLEIKSPLAGTISKLTAQIGSYVDTTSALGEIVDNTAVHVDLHIFEKDLPKVKEGQLIHFNLTNNPQKQYEAKVYRIGASFEDDSKIVPVHCSVLDDKKGLFDGMNVTAMLSLGEKTVPAVPSQAIVNANGKDYIFIVSEEDDDDHDHEGEAHSHKGHKHEGHSHEDANHEGHNHEGHDHDHEGEAHSHEGHKHEGHSHENANHEGHNHEGHDHDHAGDAHSHAGHNHDGHNHDEAGITFRKIPVVKGVSNMGYTEITLLEELPKGAKIVIKQAFFVNAKMSGSAGHGHSH